MKEFIEKLIKRLKKHSFSIVVNWEKDKYLRTDKAIEIVNQLAEEYINCSTDTSTDFCEWEYDGKFYEKCPHAEVLFARIHNCDEKTFKFCPYCGKKIKAIEPKGE